MKSYKEAAELANAFSMVISEINARLSDLEQLPIDTEEEFRDYQSFVAKLVLIQRDLEYLLDQAISLERSASEDPLQVLDFSSEWDGYD